MVIKVGVLELQGDFALHHYALERIGIESLAVKMPSDLDKIDGLIIPGGESTTMSLLANTFNMYKPLVSFGMSNPVMGTCAGLIMMAKVVVDDRIDPLGLIDVVVERNAYGRQIESSKQKVEFVFSDNHKIKLSTTLIRAPRITRIGDNIKVLGNYNNSPIAVLDGNNLGLSFHPELDEIDIFHKILFDKESEFYYKKLKHSHVA